MLTRHMRSRKEPRHTKKYSLFLIAILFPCHLMADMVTVPAGTYLIGSDAVERSWAYKNSPPLVLTQRWYDNWEKPPQTQVTSSFKIDRHPVTQKQYSLFVKATGHRTPYISSNDYQHQGYLVHPYHRVIPYLWKTHSNPTKLSNHPVVLVSWEDAKAYCQWQGKRLPSELEWEASCRGQQGNRFPWGDRWQANNLQHQAKGIAAVGDFPNGNTASGITDLLGNTFEWTQDSYHPTNDFKVLKGCSWDDAPGTCRCGFRHGRTSTARHILIGFRCAKNL